MPTIVPPGFVEAAVELRGQGDPDPWYVTFGLEVTGLGGNYAGLGLAVMQAFGNLLAPMWSGVSNTGVSFTVGQDGPDNLRVYVASGINRPGGRSSQFLPQNCATLIRKNTELGGRRNRGRMFIPAMLAEGEVDNVGVIEATSVGIFQDNADAFLDELTSIVAFPMTMVVLHGSEGISEPGDPTPVSSLTVDPIIATQRRRLR